MIQIEHLKKSYGELSVLSDINLSVGKGEAVAFIGPSGTGKSTLLRCLNFLERPDSGSITIDGVTVNAETATSAQIHALRLKSSMVFQNYNLFHNMTALQNVMAPMVTVQRLSRKKAEERARELIDRVGLSDKCDSYPKKMSGGQQQRIGIARAMAANSKVLLLDEPTSSLDPELIGEVLAVVRRLAESHVTMLIVTHEMKFAREVADKIVFLEDGVIAEEGSSEYIFEKCGNERIRRFVSSILNKQED